MAWVESPTEVRLPSPTVMVPIILARQECLRDECARCGDQNTRKGEEYLHM